MKVKNRMSCRMFLVLSLVLTAGTALAADAQDESQKILVTLVNQFFDAPQGDNNQRFAVKRAIMDHCKVGKMSDKCLETAGLIESHKLQIKATDTALAGKFIRHAVEEAGVLATDAR